MPRNSDYPQRRSIRLQNYDYAQEGLYFVTLCAYQRDCIFGTIEAEDIQLSTIGCIVAEEWERTASVRPYVTLDEFVVMPNHLHGILHIAEDSKRVCHRQTPTENDAVAGSSPPQKREYGNPVPKSLGTILLQFKSITTKRINKLLSTSDKKIWQRNYYEHIIRNEDALNNIRAYIHSNPSTWESDSENQPGPRP